MVLEFVTLPKNIVKGGFLKALLKDKSIILLEGTEGKVPESVGKVKSDPEAIAKIEKQIKANDEQFRHDISKENKPEPVPVPIDLDRLNKSELVEFAKANGIEVDASATN